jgi:zinc finger RNA-binding protein
LQIQAIQEIVSCTEKALKLVSDQIADEDHILLATESPEASTEENKSKVSPSKIDTESTPIIDNRIPKQDSIAVSSSGKEPQMFRALKGVMRVGLLAKGLLLKGDTDVQLIVLCAQKPTKSLLERVYSILLQKVDVIILRSFFIVFV